MKTRFHSLFGYAVLSVGVMSTMSCSRPSSVTPTAPSPAALQQGQHVLSASSLAAGLRASSGEVVAFPLVAGSFAIANLDGDGIVGTYTGIATFADSTHQKSSLTFEIGNGSGGFAGAHGTIAMKGNGSFADEGQFLLEGSGEITIAGGSRSIIALSLRGSSVASCSTSGQIAITQSAEGTMGRAGHVTATLSHEVGNTGCGG
jgi:hypothetical protein